LRNPTTARASIAQNTASLLAARVIGCMVTVALLAVVARKLGGVGFGIYTFALSVGAILAVVVDFGLSFLVPREVARRDSRFEDYLAAGCLIKVTFSIAVLVALVALLRLHYPRAVRYAVYAAFVTAALRGIVEFCASFFNAYERMHYSALLFLMCQLGILAASVAVLSAGIRDAWVVLSAQAAAMVVFVAAAFALTFKVLRPGKLRLSRPLCLAILKRAAPFGIFAIGGVVYFQIDNVLLSVYRDIEEVGYYQGAMRMIVALEILPLVLSNAIYPTVSRVLKESKSAATEIVQKMTHLVLVLGLPLGVTLAMLARPIVSLVLGQGYEAVPPALRIVAWLVPIRFCACVLGTAISASGHQKFRAAASWCAVVVNVVVNLILIPRYGYLGAAVTSLATSSFLLAFYYIALYVLFFRFEILAVGARLVLPLVALAVFLHAAAELNVVFAAGVGLALYCTMLVPAGVLTRASISRIGKLVLN